MNFRRNQFHINLHVTKSSLSYWKLYMYLSILNQIDCIPWCQKTILFLININISLYRRYHIQLSNRMYTMKQDVFLRNNISFHTEERMEWFVCCYAPTRVLQIGRWQMNSFVFILFHICLAWAAELLTSAYANTIRHCRCDTLYKQDEMSRRLVFGFMEPSLLPCWPRTEDSWFPLGNQEKI